MSQAPLSIPLGNWTLSIPVGRYIVFCIITSLGARVGVSFFKALEMKSGDDPSTYLTRFMRAFLSSTLTKDKDMRDYWLPAIIGFAEAATYPVLLVLGQVAAIGAWLAIKTAGQWGAWTNSRATFNRFLLGNLIILAAAYLWLSTYVTVK